MRWYNKLEDMVRRYVARPLAVAGLAGILSYGEVSYAQEFKVGSDSYPNVLMNDEGESLITWGRGRAQYYDKHGNRIGEEFQLVTERISDITMDNDGNFITVWQLYPSILAQRYDKDGNRIGKEFQVNNNSEYSQVGPAVAMNNDRFVICWKQFIFDDDPRNAFYAQIFDKDGNRAGDNFLVDEYIGGLENPADIAIRDDGDFVITWGSRPEDPLIRRSDILTKCYFRDGNESCKRTVVNTLNGGYPNISMNSEGDYVITWFAGREVGIYAQRFDKDANRIGEEFKVNSYKGDVEGGPHGVAINNFGNFIITWTSWDQDGDGGGIYAQRFDKDANRIGEEFQVNSFTENSQLNPKIAMNDNGYFVMTWINKKRGINVPPVDIYAQTFHFSDVFFRRGDANRDREYDISDPVSTLLHLFSDLELKCLDAADANDDGKLDVSDPVYSLNHLFLGKEAPPFPYPWPGKDYTQDSLDCREY